MRNSHNAKFGSRSAHTAFPSIKGMSLSVIIGELHLFEYVVAAKRLTGWFARGSLLPEWKGVEAVFSMCEDVRFDEVEKYINYKLN